MFIYNLDFSTDTIDIMRLIISDLKIESFMGRIKLRSVMASDLKGLQNLKGTKSKFA